MKELTKQWNSPITRVFDFDYTDFQPEASNISIIPLVWVQKRTAIIFARLKNSVAFLGPGIAAADCYMGETITFTPITNLPAAFINYDLAIAPGDDMGADQAIPLRELPSHPSSTPIILNFDNATQLFLILKLAAGKSVDDLTSGEATIWFTFIRLR